MASSEAHRCHGCIYDDKGYRPECTGCRRKQNVSFNTSKERVEFLSLEDKYTVAAVTYGSTKVLKRRNSM